jgi:hypothetical protein
VRSEKKPDAQGSNIHLLLYLAILLEEDRLFSFEQWL